jgi:hypothetical protein
MISPVNDFTAASSIAMQYARDFWRHRFTERTSIMTSAGRADADLAFVAAIPSAMNP